MQIEQQLILKGPFNYGGVGMVQIQFYPMHLQILCLDQKKKIREQLKFGTIVRIFRQDGKIVHHGQFKGFTIKSLLGLKTFFTDDQNLMIKVRQYFRQRVNLQGFHQLFKAIKKIGKGSFASVYLAQRLQDKKLFAVKAFSKQALLQQQKGLAPLANQIKLTRQLNHPNIMRLYQVYQSDNSVYMIVELLQFGQLYGKIKSKYQFNNLEIKTIMKGLLSGLKEMAQKNILHRDIKPENILFRNTNLQVAICDFGLATWTLQPQYIYVRCGTPGYVAPQIVNIKDLKTKSDTISDVFSAGIIFHYLLFKKTIFAGKNYNAVLAENRKCQYKLEGPPYNSISPLALDLLDRMLKKNPQERINAAESLRHPFFANKEDIHVKTISTDESLYSQSSGTLKQDSCVKFVQRKAGYTGKIDSVSLDEGSSKNKSDKHMDSPGMVKNLSKKAPIKSKFKGYVQSYQGQQK